MAQSQSGIEQVVENNKIAIFLPDLRFGGAERVCLNLANEFAVRGFQVQMVLMRAEGELLLLLDPRILVVNLDAKRVRNVLWPLIQYLRNQRPAALMANMWPLTFLAALARKLTRVGSRIVAVEHNIWSSKDAMKSLGAALVLKASMKWLLPKVDVLMAVSHGASRDLEQFAGLPHRSVGTLHNPVARKRNLPTTISTATLPLAWIHGGHRRVIAVGELKYSKDFPHLLKAFAQVAASIDARLLILGEGTMRTELEKLARELRIEDRLELPGFVSDTAPYYDRAELFVLSSNNEGFANVIVEALDHGVPVVSTDCPCGPGEILQDGKYGTLVPMGDVEALALAILNSLQSTHDHVALKFRASDFAVDKIADQYLDHLLPGWRTASHESTA